MIHSIRFDSDYCYCCCFVSFLSLVVLWFMRRTVLPDLEGGIQTSPGYGTAFHDCWVHAGWAVNDDDGLSRPFVSTAATIVVLFARMLECHTVVCMWPFPPGRHHRSLSTFHGCPLGGRRGAHVFLLAVLAFCFPTCASFVLWNHPQMVSLLQVARDCVPSEHDESKIIIVIYFCFQIAVTCSVRWSRTVR